MTGAELIAAIQALPGFATARVLVPGLAAGFDETAGAELRTLVAVASSGEQTSMGTWMDEVPGDYAEHRRCQAIVLGRKTPAA